MVTVAPDATVIGEVNVTLVAVLSVLVRVSSAYDKASLPKVTPSPKVALAVYLPSLPIKGLIVFLFFQ
ncbi:hypothetical protein [Maledivibacter halophilus]|uniref:hypothetical protein n=1 Tax=Maledivibacter halophilus TaxID=36842 RepID=UPI001482FC58|nr:hypothetical protein [Maledivibacter halophilus]